MFLAQKASVDHRMLPPMVKHLTSPRHPHGNGNTKTCYALEIFTSKDLLCLHCHKEPLVYVSAPIFSYSRGQEMRLRDQLMALDVAEALSIWIMATNGPDGDAVRAGSAEGAASLEDPPRHLRSMWKWRAGTHERGQRMVCSGMGSMAEAGKCQRGAGLGLSMSPSVDHLYSNLWVWSTCGVVTWIRMGLDAGSPGLWMITYRLPVCICACPNLHDGPMLLPGSDTPTSSTIPEDALSTSAVSTMPVITTRHHAIRTPGARREGGWHVERAGSM